jgi:hypothetical protein
MSAGNIWSHYKLETVIYVALTWRHKKEGNKIPSEYSGGVGIV